jgi:hypothetical protein
VRHYDFLLQVKTVGELLNLGAVETALTLRGALKRPDGAWVVTLQSGKVEGFAWRDEGVLSAFELKVPLSDKTELVQETLAFTLELAGALDLKAVDPQLGNPATLASGSAVADEFLRMARYAGEYLGVSEALGATNLGLTHAPESSAQSKVFWALGIFLLALYLAYKFAS